MIKSHFCSLLSSSSSILTKYRLKCFLDGCSDFASKQEDDYMLWQRSLCFQFLLVWGKWNEQQEWFYQPWFKGLHHTIRCHQWKPLDPMCLAWLYFLFMWLVLALIFLCTCTTYGSSLGWDQGGASLLALEKLILSLAPQLLLFLLLRSQFPLIEFMGGSYYF